MIIKNSYEGASYYNTKEKLGTGGAKGRVCKNDVQFEPQIAVLGLRPLKANDAVGPSRVNECNGSWKRCGQVNVDYFGGSWVGRTLGVSQFHH